MHILTCNFERTVKYDKKNFNIILFHPNFMALFPHRPIYQNKYKDCVASISKYLIIPSYLPIQYTIKKESLVKYKDTLPDSLYANV